MMGRQWIGAAGAVVLAACSAESQTPAPAPSVAPLPAASAPAGPPPSAIPAGMQGRWGLVPADCGADASIAKGLVEIGPDTLRFYEARARLIAISAGGADRIVGRFGFTGEGHAWAREETLSLHADGQALIRSETGEGAAPGPLSYIRCLAVPTG